MANSEESNLELVATPVEPTKDHLPPAPSNEEPKKRRKVPPSAPRRNKRRDNRKSRRDASFIMPDEKKNADFTDYYQKQAIVRPDEFDLFMKTLTIPLPSSFRILSDSPYREKVLENLRNDMTQLFERVQQSEKKRKQEKQSLLIDNVNNSSCNNDFDDYEMPLKPLFPLPWYPNDLAWSVSAPRQMLRRDNVLSPFHKLLVKLNQIGAINRQECVSMIPPLLLDIQPGQIIVDLCAAPGSKTAQILEFIQKTNDNLINSPGCVIANDSDLRRCWMLTHQLKRFNNPQLVVTNHEAQQFPNFMTFHRVLCDVPCSGDGTLRKAPDIWRRWNSDMGVCLHRLQKQILERGIDILKPGGILVYSTCSLNPIENEAVVAHALRKYKGDVYLEDCSNKLPMLMRRNGLNRWFVKDNGKQNKNDNSSLNAKAERVTGNMEVKKEKTKSDEQEDATGSRWFSSYDEVPIRRRKRIVESLFPPSKEELESGNFPLDRCLRLVPHDQDTGAFFVAVIHKKTTASMTRKQKREEEESQIREEELKKQKEGISRMKNEELIENAEKINDEGLKESSHVKDEVRKEPLVVKKKPRATKLISDDGLIEVRALSPLILKNVVEHFGLDIETGDNYLMTRGTDDSRIRKMVVVSRTVRSVLRHAIGCRDPDNVVPVEKRVVRVVNAGVRAFEATDRKDTVCRFRIIHDGIGLLKALMERRIFYNKGVLKTEDVVELLTKKDIQNEGVWKQVSDELGGSGSAVVEFEGEDLIVWIGRKVVNLVMAPDLVSALLMKFDDQKL